MKNTILLLLTTLLLASAAFAQVPDFQTPNANVSSFVRHRLLYGANKVTTRWPGVPKLEVTTQSPVLRAFVEQTFTGLCQAAGLTVQGEGIYNVVIGTKEEFSNVDCVKRRHPSFHMTGWYFFIAGNDLVETITINDPSRYKDEYLLQRDVFLNMLRTFGVMEDSRFPKKSPFVPTIEVDAQLLPIERLLISFNYQHVPPGMDSSEIPKLLRLYWNK